MKPSLTSFCSNTVYHILVVVIATPTISTPPVVANVLATICTSLLSCSMPRFIISVRELYDRDIRGHWQGIDTRFGATSRGVSGHKGRTSTIAFADAGQEESRTLHDDGGAPGDIQLETVGEGSRHV